LEGVATPSLVEEAARVVTSLSQKKREVLSGAKEGERHDRRVVLARGV
jgi:hypothetical protein